MGQVVAYFPDWYSAVPTVFRSTNPLIATVTLDMYTLVTDTDDGGSRPVPVVTHQSLLSWYRTNMLRFGIRKSVEVVSSSNDLKIVRCTLESPILGHTEALGEASFSNLTTRISRDHPASMAENRAFDRAVMDYLALDTQVYSSSDEIRGSIETPESAECFVRNRTANPSLEAPAGQSAPPPVPEKPVSSVPPVPPVSAAPAEPAARPDLLKEIAEHPCSDAEIQWFLPRTLNLYNSNYNGQSFGSLLDKLFTMHDRNERGELAKTFYKFMRLPVRGETEKAKEIQILKYYLYSRNVLAVSREGALYINMDKHQNAIERL